MKLAPYTGTKNTIEWPDYNLHGSNGVVLCICGDFKRS